MQVTAAAHPLPSTRLASFREALSLSAATRTLLALTRLCASVTSCMLTSSASNGRPASAASSVSKSCFNSFSQYSICLGV